MEDFSSRTMALSPAMSTSDATENRNRGRKRLRGEELPFFPKQVTSTESDSDSDSSIISQPDNLLPPSQDVDSELDGSDCEHPTLELQTQKLEPLVEDQRGDSEATEDASTSSNPCHEEHENPQAIPTMIEPSYEAFSSMPFSLLARRIQKVWERNQPGKQKLSTEDYLKALMPPEKLQQLSQTNNRPNSIYPLMRLLCPERDHRRFHTKDQLLATAYMDAFGWNRDKAQAQAMLQFRDPEAVRKAGIRTGNLAGDFSMVVYHVLMGCTTSNGSSSSSDSQSKSNSSARVSTEPSKMTLGEINQALDELASISSPSTASNHDWRNWRQIQKKKKGPSARQQRADWMKRFLNGGDRRLSPLEHRWLVRIILGDMRFGVGFEKVLSWYHVEGPSLYTGYNSLRGVCKILCQPHIQSRNRRDQTNALCLEPKASNAMNLSPSLKLETEPSRIHLGKPFTPMLSQRTGFDRLLNDVSERHRKFSGTANNEEYPRLATCALAVRHPAFTIETKLDGERMIVHYFREGGLVKIHSRNGVWFSDVYSPVLGPAIRQAVGHHDCDLILDGELIAWDDSSKETIPFGYNRTVARLRRKWMKSSGCLDWRDTNLHKGDPDCRVYGSDYFFGQQNDLLPDINGRTCWLQYVAFDVLYVGGPNARELVTSSVSPYLHGSIDPTHLGRLDLMERKKLLYRIVKHVPYCVETVQTTVVRPNGTEVDAATYFSHENPYLELGYPASLLDSITATFHEVVSGLEDLDERRRCHMSDEEISQRRADIVSRHYSKIVEDMFLEGLIFKDLSSPYMLGRGSQNNTFWRKYKPDYDCRAVASDLDLVVIGAYFGEGDRNYGNISAFLCACSDADDSDRFYPVVSVDATALRREGRKHLLAKTGFKQPFGQHPVRLGKWFRMDGRDIPKFVPHCITSGRCWNPTRKIRPDLWLDPREVGLVLVLNAGEITFSTDFPLGITLRFPRISRLRMDKKCDEIETSIGLRDILSRVQLERAQSANAVCLSSRPFNGSNFRRFLTERQSKVTKNKQRTSEIPSSLTRKMVSLSPHPMRSNIFGGLCFCVLDGTFNLSDIDKKEAEKEGWKADANTITGKRDLIAYIQKNGGSVISSPDSSCFVLGGQYDDYKVKIFIEAIMSSRCLSVQRKTKKAQKIKFLSKCQGVLRWTFPFRLCFRLGKYEPSLCTKPKVLDYIARPLSTYREICEFGTLDDSQMMERALELIGSDTSRGHMPELDSALDLMGEPGFCIKADALMYFHSPGSCDWKNAQLQSVLPLIQMRGIPVSVKFTMDVTHIIVDQLDGQEVIEYKRQASSCIRQKLKEQSHELLDAVESIYLDSDGYSVLFVTPRWIRDYLNN